MLRKSWWMLLAMLAGSQVKAQTTVYPFPENSSEFLPQSAEYQVFVVQKDQLTESFVYSSQTNFEKPEQQSDWNHWTTFEATGEIEVVLKKRKGSIENPRVYPARLGIKPSILGDEIRLKIAPPCKLLIEMEGMEEHPLFIFADAPEKNKPNRNDPNVLWFDAGKVHKVGLQFKVPNGKTLYVEGGAIVWGTFYCEDGPLKTAIKGRGILTTRSSERKPNAQNIPFTSIYGVITDLEIEGITITDPVKFCILGRSKVETDNVKLFAWYHQTDGWGGGDDSRITNSFMKVFDDNVKLYGKNQKAANLVLYQQHNGAPFQLSWGGQSGQNCLAENIDIVKCWVNKQAGVSNSALLNLRKGSNRPISTITIRNVHADQGLHQLIGVLNDQGATVQNLRLENITISQGLFQKSYLDNQQDSKLLGIALSNVTIDGKCLEKENIQLNSVPEKELTISCQSQNK
ncbi:hypothetical protein [Arundinibacter roseus]|nr:hypothetical protein [Arundinibacter roseus]